MANSQNINLKMMGNAELLALENVRFVQIHADSLTVSIQAAPQTTLLAMPSRTVWTFRADLGNTFPNFQILTNAGGNAVVIWSH